MTTSIEWVRGEDGSPGISWNALRALRTIVRGNNVKEVSANHCEHVNEACRFCYAERMNQRHNGLLFKPGHRKEYTFAIDPDKLVEPLRRKKPTRFFVESMSDAFGEWWPQEFVDQLYAVMALTPRHTYINLSKRPERRRQYLDNPETRDRIQAQMWAISDKRTDHFHGGFPLQNLIEGTSVSCQTEADDFIPILMRTNAACRAVSCEPLLGPIHLGYLCWPTQDGPLKRNGYNALIGCHYENGDMVARLPRLDWVIVGGESGLGARPMNPDWARGLRDQCQAAGVPFFFKQWGEWLPGEVYSKGESGGFTRHQDGTDGVHVGTKDVWWSGDCWAGRISSKVGKAKAGRLLDGKEHNEFAALQAKQEAA